MELVDTHCHLSFEPLLSAADAVLERAREQAVSRIIVPAYDPASWSVITELVEQQWVYGAFGLHPWQANEHLDVQRLSTLLDHPKAVAVGEIGLDTKIEEPDLDRQLEVLTPQLNLAVERDLPVILHCRGAFEKLLEGIEPFAGQLRGVVHAYSRGPELARRFVDTGLHLGFGGAVTRPRARRVRRSAQVVPLSRVVLETDAPSIGLEGVPPERAEPRHVRIIAEELARLRDLELEWLAQETTANAIRLFRL